VQGLAWLEAGSKRARQWLLDQPRNIKRALLILNDLVLLTLAVWLAFSLRWGRPYVPDREILWLVLLSAAPVGVAVFHALGLYQLVTRFLGTRGALRILGGVALSVLLWGLVIFMTVGTGDPSLVVPRGVIVIYAILAGVLLWASRETAAIALLGSAGRTTAKQDRRNVVIYGAGAAGVQLLEALRRGGEYRTVGFIDDQPGLVGQNVSGLKVYRLDKLPRLIERDEVREVLLALPERQRRERREAIRRLTAHPVRVKTMPAMEDIALGRVAVTDLKPIDIDDLLGRDPVPPDQALLARVIRGRSVMVTGAGGSIGSELVRQVLRQEPRCLVLFELSEAALFQIETEVADTLARLGQWRINEKPRVVSVLGSVLDGELLRRTIDRYGVETIYHAAAYKHVPLIEANPVAGLRNNTFGAAVLAEVAANAGVERVVLISTDKAVRPTNVMGASKRLAELIFQAAAQSAPSTVFTMVRFGNVLGSSGSVVQRFKQQIEDGGPVTVTHPEIIRYFMSVPEAATLVIQAGAMAKGGEVFVLDMGEPVKIDELARTMIQLMGLEVQDEANPDGDIAITYIGLRPGEKLYEELLIDEGASETEHPRIRRKSERSLPAEELRRELDALRKALETSDIRAIDGLLSRIVEGYSPGDRTSEAERAVLHLPASRTLH